MLERLHGWLSAIPEAYREESPWLNLLMGIGARTEQAFSLAPLCFERALAGFAETFETQQHQAEVYAELVRLFKIQVNPARYAAYMNQVLTFSLPPALKARLLMPRCYLLEGHSTVLPQVALAPSPPSDAASAFAHEHPPRPFRALPPKVLSQSQSPQRQRFVT
jgi:hypothetical protein